ncbi:cyclin-A2-2 [Cornus florida]|uniref:cyclin-A2-2 n=1 Tax=Cornus florida TaxID=4283 RepID=UPI0028A2B49A|nr:cyclin-A2-2 [Cornus florida]XP_059658060.1 cyclin-A2-2 [Cornus florida]
MNKENMTAAKFEDATVRMTRARAKALGLPEGLPTSKLLKKQDHKQVLRPRSKRAASDENKPAVSVTACLQNKKRSVLKDVTNVFCDKSYINCINAAKIEPGKKAKKGTIKKNAKVVPTVLAENAQVQAKAEKTEEISRLWMEEPREIAIPMHLKENVTIQQRKCISIGECGAADLMFVQQTSTNHAQFQSPTKKEGKICDKLEGSNDLSIANIDLNHKDPQMCSLYASDIYDNLHVMELDRRLSVNYMEILQRDITQSMRGILIDWLVEVLEEYRLVPDTLYLTVSLIDRYLSQNYIEKQRLQLLGVTCMLIASKYEEVCAPRVEEFCFVTDNTYTRAEVLKMESQVLNFLGFQLSVPTTKKFLRRFIQAAQVSYKVSSAELEFLANYLAELTLVEYSFLKILPSLIAASAVFLARWTLNQSDHPWNPTLEHYTSYKASDLEGTVLSLQDLQLNTGGCSLNAIREKYKQQKFKSVATITSSRPVQSLF